MRRTRLVAAAGALACGAAVLLGLRGSDQPFRCGDGFVAVGARCCGVGQTVSGDACVGSPSACGPDHERSPDGCVARTTRVRFAGGSLEIAPDDWESGGHADPRTVTVATFALDAFEIDLGRHDACLARGACKGPRAYGDRGRAAVLDFDEMERLCESEGGRVPTDDEWIFAATGGRPRRYPWGETGAVCGRAAFALTEGPCGRGLTAPDTVGARPRGKTSDGLFDMAGNAAEWTRGPDGPRLRGGSFASTLAAELRVWAEARSGKAGTTGGRCAYDVER